MESLIIKRLQYVVDKTDVDPLNLTPIQEFYKDTNIFITGATGFLGQILVEKLLRSCPVSKLYLLMRGKKEKDSTTRLKEIFDDHVFSGLKKIQPDFMDRVVPVEGDCACPGLGISAKDRKLLIEEVDIIFHIAATVRFDEKLKKAVPINVRSVRDLSQMAQQMTNLKSFVQVSTAFSNCIYDTIEEKIYEAPMKYTYMLEVAEKVDTLLLDNMTPYLIKNFPNTYVYTKNIAEDAFKHETLGLATGIYRPSVVVSTYKEPTRGWINNIYGATGVFFGAGIGFLKVLYCDQDNAANVVPVDMCMNGLIASAWDVTERFKKAKETNEEFEVPVYHFESSNDKHITWKDFKRLSSKYGQMIPSLKCVWIYFIILAKSYKQYLLLELLLHLTPGAFVDAILFCMGKKMRMYKVYKKIHIFSSVISYFSVKNMTFKSFNVQNMLKHMSQKDRDIFFCDLKLLDWNEFFTTYGAGARIYLAKDPLETMDKAKERMKKLRRLHQLVVTILVFLLSMILWGIVSKIYKCIFL